MDLFHGCLGDWGSSTEAHRWVNFGGDLDHDPALAEICGLGVQCLGIFISSYACMGILLHLNFFNTSGTFSSSVFHSLIYPVCITMRSTTRRNPGTLCAEKLDQAGSMHE